MKILIIHTMAIDYNGVTDCIVQYLKHMNREGMEATILSTVTVHPDFEKLFQELGCRLERIENKKRASAQIYVQTGETGQKGKV